MTVDTHPGVFVLGCLEQQITFYAQQCRACNLIWALVSTGVISAGSRVAVIGGGIGGITAAAAAILKGCAVEVFEAAGQLLHLQTGNHTRFVHPNTYFWPDASSKHDYTDLPCLNWYAAYAGDIASMLLRQWNDIEREAPVVVHTRSKVVGIIGGQGGTLSVQLAESPVSTGPFDCVILAVGFGTERKLGTIPFRSYWDSEPLHQPLKLPPIPRHILVTGCGDSGLIDAVRLRLKNFEHHKVTMSLILDQALAPIRASLGTIETHAREEVEGNPQFDIGKFLLEQYQGIQIPRSITRMLQFRDDTIVTLNDRHLSPLSLGSSVLNRFLIFLLIREGQLKYVAGKVTSESVRPTEDNGFAVTILGYSEPITLRFDDIITRQGTENALWAGFPSIAANAPNRREYMSPVATPNWQPGFFPQRSWTARPPRLTSIIHFPERAALSIATTRVQEHSDLTVVRVDQERRMLYVRPAVSDDPAAGQSLQLLIREFVTKFAAEPRSDHLQDDDTRLVQLEEPTTFEEYIPSLDEVLTLVRAPEAWRISRGKGVLIAVVDTGIDGARLEFRERNRIGWADVGTDAWTDWEGHGTMVACVAAGSRKLGGDFDGVAPDAMIVSCRTNFFDSQLAACYDFLVDLAHQGHRIVAINSFGTITGIPPEAPVDSDFLSALDDALRSNIVVVFSAGNYHGLTGASDSDLGPNSIWLHKSRADVLTVAACGLDGKVLPHSSRGPGQWFGQENTSFKPDVMAPSPVRGRVLYGSEAQILENSWGTSSACAVVGGLAALILSVRPDLSAEAVLEIIRLTARPWGNGATCEGRGLVDCVAALELARSI